MEVAILDDYQNVALELADWSRVTDSADLTVFTDHLSDPDDVVARLADFDAICVMRERTPLPRSIIERLPRLKMIASTGRGNASIDWLPPRSEASRSRHRLRADPHRRADLGLIMAAARNLAGEAHRCEPVAGRPQWDVSCGDRLWASWAWVASVARSPASEPRSAWRCWPGASTSTRRRRRAAGAIWVTKEALFTESDTLTIHLGSATEPVAWSERTNSPG